MAKRDQPWVRLAAMMPASRAAPSTSPSWHCLDHQIERLLAHDHAAFRDGDAFGGAFVGTSTMRASPRWSIWVMGSLAAAVAILPCLFGFARRARFSSTARGAFLFGRRADVFLRRAMALLRYSLARLARNKGPVAAATSSCRIRLSPIRNVEMPSAEPARTSAGVRMPLSATGTRSRGIFGARRSLTSRRS